MSLSGTSMKSKIQESPLPAIRPGVAAVTDHAPRVSSGKKTSPSGFQPLLAYLAKTDSSYTLRRGKRSVKLVCQGVKIVPKELASLIKKLPGGRRIDAATRVGQKVASYAFDGKLKRSRLVPLEENGVVLLWTDPDASLGVLEEHLPATAFKPQGQRLAKVALKKSGQRAKACIYHCQAQATPGFVLIRNGKIQHQGGWLDLLSEGQKAPATCQIVVEGDVCWQGGVPREFRGQFKKLLQMAVEKSSELVSSETPAPPEVSPDDLVERLLNSTRFLAAYQKHKNSRPPIVTLGQVLKIVCDGGGQVPITSVMDRIGLPVLRLREILAQMDSILRVDDEVVLSTSMDQKTLIVDRERLNRLFALQQSEAVDERTIRQETVLGVSREVRLPVEVTLKERRVLEALLRYSRLSEAELSEIVGSRRVGGLLERLLTRLEDNGFYRLRIVGEGAQGRVFEL